MPLRVAFDLDGTIADMHAALRQTASQLFGTDQRKSSRRPEHQSAPDEEPETKTALLELHLTSRQQVQLWEHVKSIENFWATLSELEPGIVARIARIAATRRWEVIFLTTRPVVAGDTVQIQSQRWLAEHGFQFPSVYVVHRSRGRIADALQLDAVVDDRPENCLDVAVESKAKPILIWPSSPKHVPVGAKRLGIRMARSITEAVSLLEALDDQQNESDVVRSIKKLFSKKTPV
jgi:5' nucleotidase, deoxy (Pyrimidine), cytosolic type C protein (NT5C)